MAAGLALAVLGSARAIEPPAAPAPVRPASLPPGILDHLPPPLPPPAPPPLSAPAATAAADSLELLWGHRLAFGPGGQPLITILVAGGLEEASLRPLEPVRVRLRGGPELELPAGVRLVVRARDATPARIAHAPLLAEVAWADRGALDEVRRAWEGRGIRVRTRMIGDVYGIAGKVIDTRRLRLLAAGDRGEAEAAALAGELARRTGDPVALDAEVVARPAGRLRVEGEEGALGDADEVVEIEPLAPAGGGDGIAVEAGERPGRRYRGRLLVTLDAAGRIAVVDAIELEELLRGLVPSEMPAGSPMEALEAQAVTARSNVLAQLGTRHLDGPYLLCSEVHCQAYAGVGAETARTDRAVRRTAGEALFGRADRTLVYGVYSATCGGHGESNDAVWPGRPDPSLRGHLDVRGGAAEPPDGALRGERALRAFLVDPPDAWCRRPGSPGANRFRWERRLGQAELDRLVAGLGVGAGARLEVVERGISGRAIQLRVAGAGGAVVIPGELRIRRLLGNLPSSMFVVDPAPGGVLLRGGGWGHGVGMCQWGAVGRAGAGQGYREILRAYFSGAEVARIY